MSQEPPSVDEQREQVAAAFDRDIDPLAEYDHAFRKMDADPFRMFLEEVIAEQGLADGTVRKYEGAVERWSAFMAQMGRHPACPTEQHVREYAGRRLTEVAREDTVQKELNRLNRAYEFWQNDPAFPHPIDYNPFKAALGKLALTRPDGKEQPRMPIDELAERVRQITHIRDRAIVVAQCKLGLRAGEVCNVQLQDVHLTNAELQRFYPDLGSHHGLEGRENAIFVPTRDERDGNKSQRPRVLPLDDEMRRVLIRWLLVRPGTETPWVFLSKENHNQLGNEGVNNIWVDPDGPFRPDYAETEHHDAVTSHFGRHVFTTWWRVKEDLNRDLIKYMRGDKSGGTALDSRGAIDEYIHTYYEDVEDLYRERIFRLEL